MIPFPNDISEGYSVSDLNKYRAAYNMPSPLDSSTHTPRPTTKLNLCYTPPPPFMEPIMERRLSYLLMPPELPTLTVTLSYVAAALVKPSAKGGAA